MRAAVFTRFGGPEVLEIRDEPEPQPGPDGLLVAPEAIGVNYRDIYEREGRYGGETPLIAGVEGAGTVVAGPSEGDSVAWLAAPGSYAERVVVPADKAVPIPEGISTELAAAVLLQGASPPITSPRAPIRRSAVTTCWCTQRRAGWGCC
jgi:NADPH:quinone reductase